MNTKIPERMKCWGDGEYGKTGYGDEQWRGDNPGEMGSNLPFIDVGTDFEIADFRLHWYGSLVKSTSGQFKAWGTKSVFVIVSLYHDYSDPSFLAELSKYVS